jgi:hypothetical protein
MCTIKCSKYMPAHIEYLFMVYKKIEQNTIAKK